MLLENQTGRIEFTVPGAHGLEWIAGTIIELIDKNPEATSFLFEFCGVKIEISSGFELLLPLPEDKNNFQFVFDRYSIILDKAHEILIKRSNHADNKSTE